MARDNGSIAWSSVNRIARMLGRCGFAMIGALCGLFVADDMARSDIELFGSVTFFLAMMVSGFAGFYLGLDVPASVRRRRIGGAVRPALVGLLSASGTFLTATAALISVAVVVLDELLPLTWLLLVEASWLAGATMQVGAGAIARLRTAGRSVG